MAIRSQVDYDLVAEQSTNLFHWETLCLDDVEVREDRSDDGERKVDEEHVPAAESQLESMQRGESKCETYMFLNASGDGAVKVIVPTKSENIAKLTPLARRFVGKISAVHAKAGASTHCGNVSIQSILRWVEIEGEPGRQLCTRT